MEYKCKECNTFAEYNTKDGIIKKCNCTIYERKLTIIERILSFFNFKIKVKKQQVGVYVKMTAHATGRGGLDSFKEKYLKSKYNIKD